MTKKQKVSEAIKKYNKLIRQNPELGIFAENLEWIVDDVHEIIPGPELEKKVLRKIMKKKQLENKKLEVELISYWIDSIYYPEVDENIMKMVN